MWSQPSGSLYSKHSKSDESTVLVGRKNRILWEYKRNSANSDEVNERFEKSFTNGGGDICTMF